MRSSFTRDIRRTRRDAVWLLASVLGVCGSICAACGPAAAADTCPNAMIRAEQHATALPDCRAYEQVSPEDKNGGDIHPGLVAPQSTPSGERLLYAAGGAFAGSVGTAPANYYRGDRSAAGWTTRPVSPAQAPSSSSLAVGPTYQLASTDLSRAILRSTGPLAPGAPTISPNLYVRDFDSGAYQLLTTVGPTAPDFLKPFYAPIATAASADLGHVLLESTAPLTADAPIGVTNVFEWDGGAVHLASILPNQAPAPNGAVAGDGASLGGIAYRSMSTDGSRIVFTADGRVYLRENGQTVEASASRRAAADPDGFQPAQFLEATPNLSYLLFRSGEKLTDDSTAGSGAPDLYRYDVATHALTDLSVDTIAGNGDGAGVQGVVGTSDDGQIVYFAASGTLTSDAPMSGLPSLYVSEHGVLRLVGPFRDNTNWDTIASNRLATTTVTPDGKFMLFASREQFGPFTNNGNQEIYRYSLADHASRCVSCGSSPATGDANVTTQPYGFPSSPYRVRGLLADGIVFFETPDPLVGEDTNGKGDVYKWSPDGVRLISTGHDASDAVFLDASADGSSVFFVTRERLVATDADSLRDVYVARTDGGFPSRPGSPVPCSGDQCQGRPSRVPDAPVSATTTFTGGGDVAEVGSQHVGARAVSVSKPKVAHGASAVIKVEVLTKGKIGITGSGLRSAQRTAAKAGIYTIKLSLTARARRSLSAKKAFTAKARVTFRPAVGSRTTLTVALTFKTVSTKKGR